MAYSGHASWTDRPAAVTAVIAVHVAIGYALVTGLTFVRSIPFDPPLVGETIVDQVPLDPPTAMPKPEHTRKAIIAEPVARGPIPIENLGPIDPLVGSIDTAPITGLIDGVLPDPAGSLGDRPSPFKPIAPSPLNDPGRWVTNSDYRSNWVRMGMSGTARFRLEIAANGRVAKCTITSSSGFTPLDNATCALVERRARFAAARNGNGDPVAGSYSSAVSWQLPD